MVRLLVTCVLAGSDEARRGRTGRYAARRLGLVGTGDWAAVGRARTGGQDGRRHRVHLGLGPKRNRRRRTGGRDQAMPYQDFDALPGQRGRGRLRGPAGRAGAAGHRAGPGWQAPAAGKADRAHRARRGRTSRGGSQAQVASAVLFTARFQADVRAWLAGATAIGGWAGGQAIWLGTARSPGSPFNTPWRRVRGGLWDLAPHVTSPLWASPAGHRGHRGSRAGRLTPAPRPHRAIGAAAAAPSRPAHPRAPRLPAGNCGDRRAGRPPRWRPDQPTAPLRTALAELAANARAGQLSHPCDVQFGRSVGQVLADAQHQLDARCQPAQPGTG